MWKVEQRKSTVCELGRRRLGRVEIERKKTIWYGAILEEENSRLTSKTKSKMFFFVLNFVW